VMDATFKEIAGGVTAPRGYRAAGVACGIKANGKFDLSLLVSDRVASAAGVFTTNLAKAAPVLLSVEHLERSGGRSRAIVINSGCANACTGADGQAHAKAMAEHTGAAVGCDPAAVLVASTGVIGVKLEMSNVERGVVEAASKLSPDGGANAAVAIMTTDPFPKESAIEASSRGRTFRVGGMAKGSGMIEPLMATMLAVVTTDAGVAPGLLKRAL
jgi:glutamate N-acetyltransferase / amino-acid N-acetyltransferase